MNTIDPNLTMPVGEQIRFMSARTGAWVLDTYLEMAELGNRTIADLLADLFDSNGDLIVSGLSNWLGVWQAGQSYRPGDTFKDPAATTAYVTLKAHTSSDLSADLAAGNIDTVIVGVAGPAGPPGPQGLPMPVVKLLGAFGSTQTPSSLPPGGLIPANWDAVGRPAAAHQFVSGEGMVYIPASSADPLFDHIYNYVGTAVSPAGWADVGKIAGPAGLPGGSYVVVAHLNTAPPDVNNPLIVPPQGLLVIDQDDTSHGQASLPAGGTTGQVLAKQSNTAYDTYWANAATSGVFRRLQDLGATPPDNNWSAVLTAALAAGNRRIFIDDLPNCIFDAVAINYPCMIVGGPNHAINPLSTAPSTQPMFTINANDVTFDNLTFVGYQSLAANGGQGAVITCGIVGSSLENSANIISGGNGYAGNFSYPVPGNPNGSGGVFAMTVTGGVITAAQMTAPGSGYASVSQVRLIFTPSGGTVFAGATSAGAASGTVTLTFAAVPAGVTTGMLIKDTTNPGAIPNLCAVLALTTTTITLNLPLAGNVGAGDNITFGASIELSVNDQNGALILPGVGAGTLTCVVLAGGAGYAPDGGSAGGSGPMTYNVAEGGGVGGVVVFQLAGGVISSGLVTVSGVNYVANKGSVIMGACSPKNYIKGTSVSLQTVRNCSFTGGSQAVVYNLCNDVVVENNICDYFQGPAIAVNIQSCQGSRIVGNTMRNFASGPQHGCGIRLTGDPNNMQRDSYIAYNRMYNLYGSNGVDGNVSAMRNIVIEGNVVKDADGNCFEIKMGIASTLPNIDDRGVKGVVYTGNIGEMSMDGRAIYHMHQNTPQPFEIQMDRSNLARHSSGFQDNLASVGVQVIAPQAGGPVNNCNWSPTVEGSTIGVQFSGGIGDIVCSPLCLGVRRGVQLQGGVNTGMLRPNFSGGIYRAREYGLLLTASPILQPLFNGVTIDVAGYGLDYAAGVVITAPGSGFAAGTWKLWVGGGGIGGMVTVGVFNGTLQYGSISVVDGGRNYLGNNSGSFSINVPNPYYQDGAGFSAGNVTFTVTSGRITSGVVNVPGAGYLVNGSGGGATSGSFLITIPEGARVDLTCAGGQVTIATVRNGGRNFWDTAQSWMIDPAAGGSGANFSFGLGNSIGLYLGNIDGGVISNSYIQAAGEAILHTVTSQGIVQANNVLLSTTQRPVIYTAGALVQGHRNIDISPAALTASTVYTIANNAIVLHGDHARLKPSSGTSDTLKWIYGAVANGQIITLQIDADTDSVTLDMSGNLVMGPAGTTHFLSNRLNAIAFQWRQELGKWAMLSFQINA